MQDADFTKRPGARLDYRVNWARKMSAAGDIIIAASASAPAGIVLARETFDETGHTIWLEGGATGEAYGVTSRIWTRDGRRRDASFTLGITETIDDIGDDGIGRMAIGSGLTVR